MYAALGVTDISAILPPPPAPAPVDPGMENATALKQQQLKAALMSHAWIKQVAFRRQFPYTLKVNITQYQPVAYVGSRGILSQSNHIFFPIVLHT